jgi:hypothetical protein
MRYSCNKKRLKFSYLNELDDREPWVVSILQKSGTLRSYNQLSEFDNFEPRLECGTSNASPG